MTAMRSNVFPMANARFCARRIPFNVAAVGPDDQAGDGRGGVGAERVRGENKSGARERNGGHDRTHRDPARHRQGQQERRQRDNGGNR